jgi:hypothetical protein
VSSGGPELPQRGDDTPPTWWVPHKAEFPDWRAWRGVRHFWARLPGTMRVYHADDPAALAAQIRASAGYDAEGCSVPPGAVT